MFPIFPQKSVSPAVDAGGSIGVLPIPAWTWSNLSDQGPLYGICCIVPSEWKVDCNNEEIRGIFDQIWCSSDMIHGQWWRIQIKIDAKPTARYMVPGGDLA